MKNLNKNLLIGIGNTGRSDDGLGWRFLDEIKKENNADWELIYRYQLNVEDAELVSNANRIIFVDAFNNKLEKGYAIEDCHPIVGFEYTTHALNPCTVMALCNNLYKSRPGSKVLKIQGYEWGLKEGLSPQAIKNLEKAVSYFKRKFLTSDLIEKEEQKSAD
jgi:hydrogenase maturation protease